MWLGHKRAQTRRGPWSEVAGEGLSGSQSLCTVSEGRQLEWNDNFISMKQGVLGGWNQICSHTHFEEESNLNEWGVFFFPFFFFKERCLRGKNPQHCAIEPTFWKGAIMTSHCNATCVFRGFSWCVHTAFLWQKSPVKQSKKVPHCGIFFLEQCLKSFMHKPVFTHPTMSITT